jgi:hypothetical protein
VIVTDGDNDGGTEDEECDAKGWRFASTAVTIKELIGGEGDECLIIVRDEEG